MSQFRKADDYEPVGWIRGYPVYVNTLLVALHCLALLAVTFALALQQGDWARLFAFSSADVLSTGSIWQWVTYAFVHRPSLGFVIEMFMLFSFGREVESFLGRRRYLLLYGTLLLAAPMFMTLLGVFWPMGLIGSGELHCGIFVAFALFYPSVEFYFGITARWVAWIMLGIFSLISLSVRDWSSLLALWLAAVLAWVFVEFVRGTFAFDFKRTPPKSPKIDKLPILPRQERVAEQTTPKRPEKQREAKAQTGGKAATMSKIDPLLEKISRQGLESLTSSERATLEKAREELLKE